MSAPAYWLLFFEDHDRTPELFTSEIAAVERFQAVSENWSCHLFVQHSRLIAAAPELLAALKATLGMLTHEPQLCPSFGCPRCHAESAISKAEGA